MAKNLRDDLINTEFIQKVLLHHRPDADKVEVVDFKSEAGTAKGDNFLGDLISLKVVAKIYLAGSTTNASEEKYHWMVKVLKPDPKEGVPNMGRMIGAFEREMKIYRDVLPSLTKISPLASCPLIYVEGSDGSEVLVLEHMRQHGWADAANKKQGFTIEYVTLVLEWMAKFHGLSYVMMENYPGGKTAWLNDNKWVVPISQDPPEFLEKFSKIMKDDQKKNFFKVAEILQDGDETRGYVNFLNRLVERGLWVDDLRKIMQRPKEPFSTINHLDPWFNNMLFKHDPATSLPNDVLLLDFQIASYTHPGNDLAHFLQTSTVTELREKHLNEILKSYHEKLHNVVKDAGGTLDYSFEDLLEDYRIGQAIGLVFCMFALPMVLADADDVMDFAEVDFSDAEQSKDFGERHTKKFEKILSKDPLIKSRIQGIFDEMIKAKIDDLV